MTAAPDDRSADPWPLDAVRPFVAGSLPVAIAIPEARGGWKGLLKRAAAEVLLPCCLIKRSQVLYTGWGGLGDEVLHTAVVREMARRAGGPVSVITRHGWIFKGNPNVRQVLPPDGHVFQWLRRHHSEARYGGYSKVRDPRRPRALRHQIAMICEELGLKGDVELRPELFLSPAEREASASKGNVIAIHSSVMNAVHPSYNKQWPVSRMRDVAKSLANAAKVIQVGASSDPLLPGVVDMRGEQSLRKVASILANASLFVGMEGFLTHLARAVGCRSIVIYGGYTKPDETGYPCNENLAVDLPCSPCWEPSGCNLKRKCLDVISPAMVLKAVERGLAKSGQPIETAVACIEAGADL